MEGFYYQSRSFMTVDPSAPTIGQGSCLEGQGSYHWKSHTKASKCVDLIKVHREVAAIFKSI